MNKPNYLSFNAWNREYYGAVQLRAASNERRWQMFAVIVLYVEYLALYLEAEHLNNCGAILEKKAEDLAYDGVSYVDQIRIFNEFIPLVVGGCKSVKDRETFDGWDDYFSLHEWEMRMCTNEKGNLNTEMLKARQQCR